MRMRRHYSEVVGQLFRYDTVHISDKAPRGCNI